MKSTVLICPAETVYGGNAFFAAIGMAERGDASITVELSPTGKAPVTHYGCHAMFNLDLRDKAAIRDIYVPQLKGHPDFEAMTAWGDACHVAQQDENRIRPFEYFDQQIAALGLERIETNE